MALSCYKLWKFARPHIRLNFLHDNVKYYTNYSTRKSSTSNIKTALGGMTPGCPLDP